jgi:pumilio RNA-binding family
VDVVEIESLKDLTRFTNEDKAQAETDWRNSLMRDLNAKDRDIRWATLARLEGSVLQLSMHREGSAVVQRAFEVARPGEEQDTFVGELHGHVRKLVLSSVGCEVLQTCIELMRPASAGFIAKELVGIASSVVRLEDGHQVLCRILEHLPRLYTAPLVLQILSTRQAATLCCDEHASLVLQHILEYGSSQEQLRVCELLIADIRIFRTHPVAYTIVQKALECPYHAMVHESVVETGLLNAL